MLPCMFAHASRSCFWDPEHLPASSQCQKGLSPARLWGIYGLYWIHNFFKCVGYSIMFQNSGVSEENPVFWMITRLLWHVWWITRLLDHNPLFCGVWVPQVYIYISIDKLLQCIYPLYIHHQCSVKTRGDKTASGAKIPRKNHLNITVKVQGKQWVFVRFWR